LGSNLDGVDIDLLKNALRSVRCHFQTLSSAGVRAR
jgi:hypothetical protein